MVRATLTAAIIGGATMLLAACGPTSTVTVDREERGGIPAHSVRNAILLKPAEDYVDNSVLNPRGVRLNEEETMNLSELIREFNQHINALIDDRREIREKLIREKLLAGDYQPVDDLVDGAPVSLPAGYACAVRYVNRRQVMVTVGPEDSNAFELARVAAIEVRHQGLYEIAAFFQAIPAGE